MQKRIQSLRGKYKNVLSDSNSFANEKSENVIAELKAENAALKAKLSNAGCHSCFNGPIATQNVKICLSCKRAYVRGFGYNDKWESK